MSTMKLTILGMENYLKSNGRSIFDGFNLPENDIVDKDTVTDNIMLQCADFEALYANPDFFRDAVFVWSRKYNRTFQKWIDALSIKYEPLWNYDKTETITDKTTNTGSYQTDNTSTSSGNQTTNNRTTDNGNNLSQVSAFNSEDFENSALDTNSNTNVVNGDLNTSATGSGTDKNKHEDVTIFEHSNRTTGNIGVTTSMELLEHELEIDRWNIVNEITNLFLDEFMIPVYI